MKPQCSNDLSQESISNSRSGNNLPEQQQQARSPSYGRKIDLKARGTIKSTGSTHSSSMGNKTSSTRTKPREPRKEKERTDNLRDLEQRGAKQPAVSRLELEAVKNDRVQNGGASSSRTVRDLTTEMEKFRPLSARHNISSSRKTETHSGSSTRGSIETPTNCKSPKSKVDAPDNALSYSTAAYSEATTPTLEKADYASPNSCLDFSPAKVLDGQGRHDVARHDEDVTRKGLQSTSPKSNKSATRGTATETVQQQQSSSKLSDRQSNPPFLDKFTPAINGGSYRQNVQPATATFESSNSGSPLGTTNPTFISTKITSTPGLKITSIPLDFSPPCYKTRGDDEETTTIFPGEGKESRDCRVQSYEGFHQSGNSSPIDKNTVLDATMMKMVLNFMPNLTLSDFELKTTLGTGTYGRVRLCKLKKYENSIPLALKIIQKREVIRLSQVEHVKSEKNILQGIHHPFIVNLFASFQDSKNLFMVMEFVQGGEFFTHLRKVGKLKSDACRFYASEIALALEYLHSRDIVYRDIKPENLLIDSEGHIKITDFGFAKVVRDRTFTLCGTPEYMAPEVFRPPFAHGKSADWWSLGILIFEMMTGDPPFYDDNQTVLYNKACAGKIDFPSTMSSTAKDLIKRLLSVDISKRYGCLSGGAEDVKQHKWFKPVDWDKCFKRQLKPPFIPKIESPDDTSSFTTFYPDSIQATFIVTPEEQTLFANF